MAKKRFSPKRNFNKTNIGKVPNDKPIVYEIKNNKGRNIYTGSAQRGRGQDRLMEHLSGGGDPVPGAQAFSIKPKPSIDSARAEEKRIIKSEKPKHNEQGK